MNETIANFTANYTQEAANETIKQSVNQAGGWGLDSVLNFTWGDGLAAWLNVTLNTQFFTGHLISALLPALTIGFLYFKWEAIMNFIASTGKILLVLLFLFVVVKALGVL